MDYLPHKGASMWPLIVDGDEIGIHFFEKPKKIDQFRLGAVVLHKDEHEWMVHRVVWADHKKVLKGDFSNNYFHSEGEIVWGVADGSIDSAFLAAVSARNISSNKLLRKFRKLILYVLARWTRLSKSKRYLRLHPAD